MRPPRLRRHADDLQFDAVFCNHPFAVYALDPQRRFLNANAQAQKELKFDMAGLLGKSFEQLIVPETRAQARFDDTLRGNSASYQSTCHAAVQMDVGIDAVLQGALGLRRIGEGA